MFVGREQQGQPFAIGRPPANRPLIQLRIDQRLPDVGGGGLAGRLGSGSEIRHHGDRIRGAVHRRLVGRVVPDIIVINDMLVLKLGELVVLLQVKPQQALKDPRGDGTIDQPPRHVAAGQLPDRRMHILGDFAVPRDPGEHARAPRIAPSSQSRCASRWS